MENNFKFYNTLTKKSETVIPHEDGKSQCTPVVLLCIILHISET